MFGLLIFQRIVGIVLVAALPLALAFGVASGAGALAGLFDRIPGAGVIMQNWANFSQHPVRRLMPSLNLEIILKRYQMNSWLSLLRKREMGDIPYGKT